MEKKDAMDSWWRIPGPLPTALLTCVDARGKPNIITIAWNMPVSLKPPLLAVSIGKKRYSHRLLEETGEFVLNIPPAELIEKVQYCGSVSGRDVNKFKESGLTPALAKKVKPPIIKECMAHIECRVVDKISAGDHTIFIGEVLAAYADEDSYTVQWDVSKAKHLLHVGGNSYTEPGEPITAP